MKVKWKPWMLWVDKKTGKLKPFAPSRVVKKYQQYLEQRRRYKDPDSAE